MAGICPQPDVLDVVQALHSPLGGPSKADIHNNASFLLGGRENELVDESDAESIYESRKLLIRQMQGQIAKQVRSKS